MDKSLLFDIRAPLHILDSETKTYGCRANNPYICSSCELDGVCAFVTDDHICYKPSKKWKKIFHELQGDK